VRRDRVGAVWEKLSKQFKEEEATHESQFEDSAGNVLDKRTYTDLARQGLL
jgi:hypothetical protein